MPLDIDRDTKQISGPVRKFRVSTNPFVYPIMMIHDEGQEPIQPACFLGRRNPLGTADDVWIRNFVESEVTRIAP